MSPRLWWIVVILSKSILYENDYTAPNQVDLTLEEILIKVYGQPNRFIESSSPLGYKIEHKFSSSPFQIEYEHIAIVEWNYNNITLALHNRGSIDTDSYLNRLREYKEKRELNYESRPPVKRIEGEIQYSLIFKNKTNPVPKDFRFTMKRRKEEITSKEKLKESVKNL